MDPTTADAEGLLTKLREFARGLGSEERALLGALVAPGVARAIGAEPDVQGFGLSPDGTGPLPAALRSALRHHPEVLPSVAADVVQEPDPPV